MKRLVTSLVAAAVSIPLVGCDLDVGDLNNPALEDLRNNPTRTLVNSSTTGLIIGHRGNLAATNGYILQLGTLGREAYNFDGADPRLIGELLLGTLNPGGPFGGNFWPIQYANLRQAQIVLEAKDKVTDYTPEEQAALTGFINTIMAMDLLIVVNAHDTNGAVIDVTREAGDELAPVVDKAAAMAEIAKRLDDGKTALLAAGADTAFPFALSNGFAGFNTPPDFLKFNRALRARVAAYNGDYATVLSALAESFIATEAATLATLNVGVYMTYSTSSGDAVNALVTPTIYANPKLITDAKPQAAAPMEKDARVVRKLVKVPDTEIGESGGIVSDQRFALYTSPTSSVPLIRNEELILLRAEAKAKQATPDFVGATEDLNIVRTISGGVAPVATLTAETAENEILYDRRYSLLFEGGHRWIDMRRFGRVEELRMDDQVIPDDPATPEDESVTFELNVRYPLPQDECNGRPDEPRCDLGSTD
jgi:starch-binding outer membrane protein, SusD/RagB family